MGFITYNFPTKILFGPGACTMLPGMLKAEHLLRPLIVTDRGLKEHPTLLQVTNTLVNEFAFEVYAEIWGNPTESQVMAGVGVYHQAGCDAIVAVGGGAAMDVAKAIALLINHSGKLFDYEDGKVDLSVIDRAIPFLVAIPTTAGTGSEVGRSAVISENESKTKRIIFSPRLMPKVALVDPNLTLDLPANLSAATGMDALSHLLEAYLAKGFNPMCDGIALEGMRLVERSLSKCVEYAHMAGDRSDQHLEARGLMMNAALMGAVAFQKGLGVTHSCAHALSAVYDLHHGLACALMLSAAMEYNLEAVPDRFRVLAGIATGSSQPEKFICWLERLKREISIPETLSAVGVGADKLESLVEYAYIDGCHHCNPRTVNKKDLRSIFLRAIGA